MVKRELLPTVKLTSYYGKVTVEFENVRPNTQNNSSVGGGGGEAIAQCSLELITRG